MRKIIATLAAAGVLCVATMTGAQASRLGDKALVGTWTGTVTHQGTTGDIILVFTRSGKACLITSAGLSAGTWASTGADTFNFTIKEALIDGTGAQQGWIYIDQNTLEVTNRLVSSGTSLVYDMNGNLQFSVVADVSAQRSGGSHRC